jgi:hypothetical protein
MVMTRKEMESMNLTWWQKEDLLDLLRKYPEIELATREQLEKFKQEKYWEAQGLIEEAERIEAEGDVIQLYIQYFVEE